MMKLTALTLILLLSMLSVSAKDFKGAEYRTKQSFTYGRFEVKIKSPGKEGVLCSFFTYYDGPGGVDTWNEIDVEIMGRYDKAVQFNAITPGQVNHVRSHALNFNPALDYHTYAFEWTPTYVSWFVDGVEVHKQTGPHVESLTRAQKIMMNIWNPTYTNWAGKWNPDILPAFAYYDSVRYYAYTPNSGNYGTNNNFTHSWSDPMDSFDTNIWAKATHTFNGNNCDFIPENAVFQNNVMVLCLTNPTNTGYIDVKGPVALWGRIESNKVNIYFSEELDDATAIAATSYILTGLTINSIALLEDKRTVQLSVSGVVPDNNYSIIIWKVKDTFGNVMASKSLALINMVTPTFPLKINTGGTSVLGYLADQEFDENTDYGFMDGTSTQFSTTLQINGTDEDAVYQSEKFGMACYKVRVPNGNYNVKFMFAENYFTQAGKRIFDVYVQDNQVINNLDIYQQSGIRTAYEFKVNYVNVTNGLLEVYFSAEIDNPLINGIVITQNSTGNIEDNNIPESPELYQNYPNPFNGSTNIRFRLTKDEPVGIKVYCITGEELFSYLYNGVAGENNYLWNASGNGKKLSSGVYFYSIRGEAFNQTKKLIILN